MLYVNPLDAGNATRIDLTKDPGAKQKVALEELEHLFLFTLLQEMRKTVPILEETEGGPERGLYEEMLDDALSGQMASSGQMGIAKQIQEQLRTAEMQHAIQKTIAEHEAQARREAQVKAEAIPSDK